MCVLPPPPWLLERRGHIFASLRCVFTLMERPEDTSELQSRLSSLSISSFPGITSKQFDSRPPDRYPAAKVLLLGMGLILLCAICPVFRLQSTDVSQSCTQFQKQAAMEDSEQHAQVVCVHSRTVFIFEAVTSLLCVFVCVCVLRVIKRPLLSQSSGREERTATVSRMMTQKVRDLLLLFSYLFYSTSIQ